MKLRRPPPSVQIESRAFHDACVTAQERMPLETGGILLGWRDINCIHVARFIEVQDPNAQRGTYERDHAAGQAALRSAQASLPPDSLLGYVGEWHTHPALQSPSRQDRRELRALGRRSAQPVAMIVLSSTGADWQSFALAAAGRWVRATVSIRKEE
jgi:integrative and conjugative element protein (TIGR02256 family)